MTEVKRKDRETIESLLRRFSRKVQQSRILRIARRKNDREQVVSKTRKRERALYNISIRKEIDRSKKMGRFDEKELREIKKRMGNR
ncbi:MAG: 30S ribosomal protein S21 [Candidatus Moraniibacteriota bacterium]|nr:MAG: 30S ribosomal protein S21 [Candidatus Moranbacteria bacterium]